MEILLSDDAIGTIICQAISTIERNHKNYHPFRKKLANISDEQIKEMREKIQIEPTMVANNDSIDIATFFIALFEETEIALLKTIELIQSGLGGKNEVILLFLLINEQLNSLTSLALIVGGGLLSDDQARELKVEVMSLNGRNGGFRKWEKDPRTVALKKIKEHWVGWQSDKSLYKSKAAFARDMVDAYLEIESTKNIEDKCREWEEELRKQ